MNDSDKYILDAIKKWVWSGFYLPEDANRMIDDILEEDADETMLRAAIGPEFDRKAKAELSWPEQTDCDRLDAAFDELTSKGIIALSNAGYTQSDGHSEVAEAQQRQPACEYIGYCFYHGQDVERAIDGGGLYIAFGPLNVADDAKSVAVGDTIVRWLKSFRFEVHWNGSAKTRIYLPKFDWKRRATY